MTLIGYLDFAIPFEILFLRSVCSNKPITVRLKLVKLISKCMSKSLRIVLFVWKVIDIYFSEILFKGYIFIKIKYIRKILLKQTYKGDFWKTRIYITVYKKRWNIECPWRKFRVRIKEPMSTELCGGTLFHLIWILNYLFILVKNILSYSIYANGECGSFWFHLKCFEFLIITLKIVCLYSSRFQLPWPYWY